MQPVSMEMLVFANGKIQYTHCIEGQTDDGETVYIGLGYLPGIENVVLPGGMAVTYQGVTRSPVQLSRTINADTQIIGFSF